MVLVLLFVCVRSVFLCLSGRFFKGIIFIGGEGKKTRANAISLLNNPLFRYNLFFSFFVSFSYCTSRFEVSSLSFLFGSLAFSCLRPSRNKTSAACPQFKKRGAVLRFIDRNTTIFSLFCADADFNSRFICECVTVTLRLCSSPCGEKVTSHPLIP